MNKETTMERRKYPHYPYVSRQAKQWAMNEMYLRDAAIALGEMVITTTMPLDAYKKRLHCHNNYRSFNN